MKRHWILFLSSLFFTLIIHAQNSQLALQYFDDGEFDKALPLFEQLYKDQSYNTTWLTYLAKCHQQLEQYEEAKQLFVKQIEKTKRKLPLLEIELGYNYLLQDDKVTAKTYFNKAIEYVKEKPEYAGTIGHRFHSYSLLDEAIASYTLGMQLNTALNYSYVLATIYGEQGNIEKMFDTLLSYMKSNMNQETRIKGAFAQFITEDSSNENNKILRILLLKRSQNNPDVLWNQMLSWLFVQQKQYNMAFIQEKAIYRRNKELSLDRLTDLALSAEEDNENAIAIEIYSFIIEKSSFKGAVLEAELAIIDLQIAQKEIPIKDIEEKFNDLLKTYGMIPQTVQLHIDYAHFIAFLKNEPQLASSHLKKVLKLNLSLHDEAYIKMELADILVYEEHFNEALIYYSQIQAKLKNDVMAQNALFKVAQTSFYKGDFTWAENQLNILKQSTSQLIANDALQLKLLISDNSLDDSLQTALKIYAKADLLAYQKKDNEAIALLDKIVKNHKGESIEDEALFKQGKLFEQQGNYEKAITNYEKILAFFNDDILADDTLFALANLYDKQLNNPEKAKEYYEKIIFNHQDSIYFVAARKSYRRLRGDQIGS
ncbi:hypothetical protein NBRC110019_17180 [Neptunitalea chrysea]|uniref:Tetratricopeptide repeat protein n=1 Tax=Neptunitalea chrysea TaxID=1647581 RepID=A0A9W6B8A7_9FLAO|nr:tetratricopeptide repeat protein [Neptunitalea chrysea]GLB52678.1 hypothetical protein NBRC110019_17180 [Neptunitalea chrysea]